MAMINLLPDSTKNEIQAARHNVLLLRYIGITLLAIAALFGVMYSSYLILTDTKASAENIIDSSTIEADVYNDTKAKVNQLSSQVTDAQAVMQQEVNFSHILTEMAALMPEGTVIKDIELSTASIDSPLSIVIFAKTTDSLLNMQKSFQNSPMFLSVDFQTIGESDGSVPGYPNSVTMTVIINRTNL